MVLVAAGRGYRASMGPPLFSGGNFQGKKPLPTTSARFNGAAAVQRRKYPHHRRATSTCWCFNGAAAVQRRKSLPAGESIRAPPCFNGAAAVQRRKYTAVASQAKRLLQLQWGRRCSAAEMSSRSWLHCARRSLQWGRRCSAAEIRPNLSWKTYLQQLQWGRRCSAAEIAGRAVRHHAGRVASMGPPLFSGGNWLGSVFHSH